MIRVVVFDCDGVLLESVDAKSRAFEDVVCEHGDEAKALIRKYHQAHGGINRLEKFKYFYRKFLGREARSDELDAMCDRFVSHCLDNVLECPEVEGARDCLHDLHGRIPMYVASGAPQDELRMILKKRGMAEFFEGIYGAPDTKGVILRRVMEKTGVSPDEILMVGDSSTDMDAAIEVGTAFYGRGHFPGSCPWSEDLRPLSDFVNRGRA